MPEAQEIKKLHIDAMQLKAMHFLPVQIDRHNIMTQIIRNQQEVHDTCSTSGENCFPDFELGSFFAFSLALFLTKCVSSIWGVVNMVNNDTGVSNICRSFEAIISMIVQPLGTGCVKRWVVRGVQHLD